MAGLSAKAIGRDLLIAVGLSVVAGFYTSLAMPEIQVTHGSDHARCEYF